MTRDLYIRTKTEVRRYPLGKNVRPLTIVTKRLFRTDERYMIASKDSDHEWVMYDLDGTQPYYAPEIVSPDETMALCDIAKSGGKAVTKLDAFNTINPMWLIYGIVGAIIVYAVVTGGLG